KDSGLVGFDPCEGTLENCNVMVELLLRLVAGAEEEAGRVRKLLRPNCRDDGAEVVAEIYLLALVFTPGETLHDIAMQIRMFPPVAEFDRFRAKTKAVLLQVPDHYELLAGEIHVE